MDVRKLTAEFVGTFLLVFLAVGTAIFGISATWAPTATVRDLVLSVSL